MKVGYTFANWDTTRFRALGALLFGVLAGSAFLGVRIMAADKPVYMESQRVLDNFGKQGGNPLIPGEAYRVQTDRRTANGNIEIHEKETDIFYIMDGSATIIVGGTP